MRFLSCAPLGDDLLLEEIIMSDTNQIYPMTLLKEHKLSVPIPVMFAPKPDITAYELATAVPFFFGKPMNQETWDALDESQRRHWRREAK